MFANRSIACAFAMTVAGSAMAADKPTPYTPTPASGWIVTVKANAVSGPKWDGADTNGFIAYPSLSFRRAGTKPKWSSPDDGIGFSLVDTGPFEMGPVARIRSGRYNGGDWRLAGIHDVKWTVEPGVFANFWITPNLRARAEARHGFRSQDGFHANFGLDWVQAFDRFTFAIGPRLEVADSKFMRTNFGVTALDASRNALVWTYNAGGGVKSYGVYSSLGYQFNDSWSATLHGGYNRLANEPGNSPIVKRIGSSNQFIVGLQLAYSFPISGF
ncbi:MAG TPA: MipA/OmpV family protein [Beijerinckiaceae bacterium]|nr:MipA/OmpV family protein [Beijerinckiaceae bacterium]